MKNIILVLTVLLIFNGCVGYKKKNGLVYYEYWDGIDQTRTVPLDDVDYNTFKIIKHDYAIDKKNVYLASSVITGADPVSFKVLSKSYALDDYHVYHEGMKIVGADPKSFSLIDEYKYARDKNNVYDYGKPIQVCDVASFKIIKDSWQVDSKCAYSHSELMKNADVKTFKVLNSYYAKDIKYVYSSTKGVIPGADPHTFEERDGSCLPCAIDKNYCYSYGDKVSCDSD